MVLSAMVSSCVRIGMMPSHSRADGVTVTEAGTRMGSTLSSFSVFNEEQSLTDHL